MNPEKTRELKYRQRAIGFALKRVFDDITSEPVPIELLELLRKIDGKQEG